MLQRYILADGVIVLAAIPFWVSCLISTPEGAWLVEHNLFWVDVFNLKWNLRYIERDRPRHSEQDAFTRPRYAYGICISRFWSGSGEMPLANFQRTHIFIIVFAHIQEQDVAYLGHSHFPWGFGSAC